MNGIIGDFINDSVLVIDSAGPVSRKGMFKGFGLSDTIEWISDDVLD
jgi:hypothetical protein